MGKKKTKSGAAIVPYEPGEIVGRKPIPVQPKAKPAKKKSPSSGPHQGSQTAAEYASQICALGKLDCCMCPVPGLPATNVTSLSSVEIIKVTSDAAGYYYGIYNPHLTGGTVNGATITAGNTPSGWGGGDAQDVASFTGNVYWQRLVGFEVVVTYLGNATTDVKGTVQVGWITHPASFASSPITGLMDEPTMQPSYHVGLEGVGGSVVFRPPMMTDQYPNFETPAQSTSAATTARPSWPSIALVVMGSTPSTDLYRVKITRKYDIVPIAGGVLRSMAKPQESNSGLKDFAYNLWAKTTGAWSAMPDTIRSAGKGLLQKAVSLGAQTIVGASTGGLASLMPAVVPLLLGN